jgi:hypothetical protein
VNHTSPTAGEALPADVAATAIERGLGERTVTCIGLKPWGRPANLVYAALMGGISAWFAVSLVKTATSDETGWLYWIDISYKSAIVACGLILAFAPIDPRLQRMRIFAFTGGFVYRDRRMRLTVYSWAEVTRVARIRAREVPTVYYFIAQAEGRGIRVTPSRFSHWTEFVEQLRREVNSRGRSINGE